MKYYFLINSLKCIPEFLYKYINVFDIFCILNILIELETNYLLINICKILQILLLAYYCNISV